MTDALDMRKTADELDLEAKLHQMFPKQKKKEISDRQYEIMLMKSC